MRSALLRTAPSGTRRTLRSIVASAAAVALATGGLLLAGVPLSAAATEANDPSSTTPAAQPTAAPSAAPAEQSAPNPAPAAPTPTASPSPSARTATPAYRIVLWKGGPGQQWPAGGQRIVTSLLTSSTSLSQLDARATECGIPYQVDLYANDQTTTDLVALGVLRGPGNPTESWPGGAYTSAYSRVFTTASCTPPPATPSVSVTVGACSAPAGQGGVSTVTADVSGTRPGRTYSAALSPVGASTPKTFTGQAGAVRLDFGPQPAGVASYTVTVTDQGGYLVARASAPSSGCPKVGGVALEITPCTAPGGSAVLAVTSSDGFVSGRSYQVRSGSARGPAVGAPFTATAATRYEIQLAPPATSGSLDLFVVDASTGTPVDAVGSGVTLAPCPTQPKLSSLSVETCTIGATASDVTLSLGGLTPGRAYQPTLDGQPVGDQVTPSRATDSVVLRNVAPGPHTVGVVDVLAPGVTASQPVTVLACPTRPTVTVVPAQCTIPGGTGSLAADLSDLVAGRSYTATLATGGAPVDSRTFTAAGASARLDFPGLAPTATYALTVTDVLDPDAATTVVIRMDGCPQVAALSVECTTDAGVATLAFAASDLATGQIWTVRFERQTAAGGFTTVSERTNLATVTPADLRLAGVSAGQTYRVSIVSQTNAALSDSLVVPVPEGCTSGRVGGVSYTAGGSVSALAATGTDTVRLAVLALLLVVPGAGLIGFALLRHRREVGE